MKKTKDDIAFNKDVSVVRSPGKIGQFYEKVKFLGEGSYGKVYRVKHKLSGAYRACKELFKQKIADMAKFNNEIAIMKKCDHPNIINLYEIFEDNRHIFLIMDECVGGELFDKILERLNQGEMYSEKEAAQIFKQVMSAIAYCHSQGICHRDIKPENILFVNKNRDSPIKVIDFGLSKIFGEPKPTLKGMKQEKNAMTTKVGTAYYVSPEILQGNYDEKCDVWSAGVILYILLSGEPPFNGETDYDIYKQISKKKYTFPEDIWKNVSDEAKDIIKKMMCDAEKRYTAEMILNHPWLDKNAPNSTGNLSNLNIKALKTYVSSCKLRKIAMNFIASRLVDDEVENLRKIFQELDTNQNGTISLDELAKGIEKLEETGIKAGNDIKMIFDAMDTDHSGRIEYTEFIASTMDQKLYQREERLLEAFGMFDRDGSGKITKNELLGVLKAEQQISEEIISKYVKDFDLDGDGEIDYNEFINIIAQENKITELKEN